MWCVVRDYQRGLGFWLGGFTASVAMMVGGHRVMVAKSEPAAPSYPALASDNLMLRCRVTELEGELALYKIPAQRCPVTPVEAIP